MENFPTTMRNSWDTNVKITAASPELVQASARVQDGSPFFDGHFPDHPVVPGIAMLAMVEQVVGQGLSGVKVAGFKRVRFRQAVEEGGEFAVTLRPSPRWPGERFLFEVRYAEKRACDGQVLVTRRGS